MLERRQADIVGKRLKEVRTEHSLYQKDLAKMIGSSVAQVSKLERGERLPDMQMLLKAARVFKVTVGWIMGELTAPKYELTASFVMIAYRRLEVPLKQRAEEIGISLTEEQTRSAIAFLLDNLPLTVLDLPSLEKVWDQDQQLIDSTLIVYGTRISS